MLWCESVTGVTRVWRVRHTYRDCAPPLCNLISKRQERPNLAFEEKKKNFDNVLMRYRGPGEVNLTSIWYLYSNIQEILATLLQIITISDKSP